MKDVKNNVIGSIKGDITLVTPSKKNINKKQTGNKHEGKIMSNSKEQMTLESDHEDIQKKYYSAIEDVENHKAQDY